MIQLLQPADGSVIAPLDEERSRIVNDPRWETDPVHDPLIKTDPEKDLSKPDGLLFQWSAPGEALLEIARDPDFTQIEQSLSRFNSACVYNLYMEQRYYWRVRTAEETSGVFTFITGRGVRMIHLPDVTNVRDMGTWRTSDGKKIRQGLLYRGAKFNVISERDILPAITEEGIRVLLNDLKVRTELDLRADGISTVSNGRYGFHYIKSGLSAYATWGTEGVFAPEQRESLCRIFHILAVKAFYPVYFHCAGGGDRTGTLAYLLEMILGVSHEDAVRDYEFSVLSVSGERQRYSEVWVKFMERLERFGGDSRKEQVERFLAECGVTSAVLDSIREILLEEDHI